MYNTTLCTIFTKKLLHYSEGVSNAASVGRMVHLKMFSLLTPFISLNFPFFESRENTIEFLFFCLSKSECKKKKIYIYIYIYICGTLIALEVNPTMITKLWSDLHKRLQGMKMKYKNKP